MAHAPFVHLRVHSAYSLSEGAIKIKYLVKLCAGQAMPAVAVTDTNNLFGGLEFALAAADAGVQPIIGCQLAVRAESGGTGAVSSDRASSLSRLVLLVQTIAGYRSLMRLISRAYLEDESQVDPHLPLAALDGCTEGLIALTGGIDGPLGQTLLANRPQVAETCLRQLIGLFPGRLYIELQRHPTWEKAGLEQRLEPQLLALADRFALPLVATNDCFFATEAMYEAHDALLCIAEGRYLSETDRRRLSPDHRLKSPEEMRTLFDDIPEAVDNTLVIARRCSFLLKPVRPILPAFPTDGVRSEAEELRVRARAGLEWRLADQVFTPEMTAEEREACARRYHDRLEFELNVIETMKFPGYFLIVSDFIQWAKQQRIPVGPGRGSGAGSVVAWVLTITDLDPIHFGLLFERFLNPERVSMPDFDIDFCQDRRDEVIRYVQKKYGRDRVAQIITFGKMQARVVLRDVGRVLQLPHGLVDKLCKLVPNNPANPVTLQQAIDGEAALQAQRDSDPQIARMMAIALRLEGLYRHASTHAAGVVIGDRPLDELVPLYRDPRSDMPVTQFNMKYVEQAGLVKFDFLGLKTLTVLETAVDLVGGRERLDLTRLPFTDEKTYTLLSRAETTGVFQLESSGMRDVLRRTRPNRLEDVIALVALYRPGPMDNIPKFIAVKHGQEPPDYLHPSLEPILTETFGIMIYQEQVMQIAQTLAGYSLGGADLLRRAMGKKIQAEMDAQRTSFVEGAVGRGVDAEPAGGIFDQVAKFAGYGFNKSHAAAYAVVAYQTAWLKANHPVAFIAASMTLELGNTDKLNVFRQELARLGIRLLPPDVNRSGDVFTVETAADGEQAIRYALAAIKGLGRPAMAGLVAERTRGGAFRSLFDLASRLDTKLINKRQLEALARAGALDGIDSNRARSTAAAELLMRHAQSAAAERQSGQVSLFGGSGSDMALREPPLPSVRDWEPLERLRHEFDAIGFYLSAHPLDAYARPLARLGATTAAGLTARAARGQNGRVRMAGVVVARQERTARSGNRFAFVQLSDASGVFEMTVFSEVLATSRDLLEPGTTVMATVEPQLNGEELRLTCHELKALDAVVADVTEGLTLHAAETLDLGALQTAIGTLLRGRGRLSVRIDIDAGTAADIDLPGHYAVTPSTRAALRTVPGVLEVLDL